MRNARKVCSTLVLVLILLILVVSPVLAATYSAVYTIAESSGNDYTMLAVSVAANNRWMV